MLLWDPGPGRATAAGLPRSSGHGVGGWHPGGAGLVWGLWVVSSSEIPKVCGDCPAFVWCGRGATPPYWRKGDAQACLPGFAERLATPRRAACLLKLHEVAPDTPACDLAGDAEGLLFEHPLPEWACEGELQLGVHRRYRRPGSPRGRSVIGS